MGHYALKSLGLLCTRTFYHLWVNLIQKSSKYCELEYMLDQSDAKFYGMTSDIILKTGLSLKSGLKTIF